MRPGSGSSTCARGAVTPGPPEELARAWMAMVKGLAPYPHSETPPGAKQ